MINRVTYKVRAWIVPEHHSPIPALVIVELGNAGFALYPVVIVISEIKTSRNSSKPIIDCEITYLILASAK